jgi:Na+-transporting NADH:ubiquinone oxidoreductase subunit F
MSDFWQTTVYGTLTFTLVGVGLAIVILIIRWLFGPKGSCTITINEDPRLTKTVDAGQTLLSALTHTGIPIPSPCGGRGTCKQCRLRIIKGAEEPFETDISTFSQKQLQEGWRLSCQVRLRNDISIFVDEQILNVQEWKATVISNENVASFIKELIVRIPDSPPLLYKPGCFLQITAPSFRTSTDDWKATIDKKFWSEWERYGMFGRTLDFHSHTRESRAYSLASYPGEGTKLIFNVRIATPPLEQGKVSKKIPWGFCSSYLFSLKPGDTLQLKGPYGSSFMKGGTEDLIFLIGGAGSSFCRSHIMQLFRTEQTHRKVSLWYGARSMRENIYQTAFEKLEKEYPNFSYHLVLSEPTQEDIAAGWPQHDATKTNFLFAAFEIGQLQKMERPEEALFYVCGPPLHNKSVLHLLDNYGVPRENVVLDDFCS